MLKNIKDNARKPVMGLAPKTPGESLLLLDWAKSPTGNGLLCLILPPESGNGKFDPLNHPSHPIYVSIIIFMHNGTFMLHNLAPRG